MKIVVLGSTGLIGNAVGRHMLEIYGEDNVWLSYRGDQNSLSYGKHTIEFSLPPLMHTCCKIDQGTDYVINCTGISKPFVKKEGVRKTVLINSVFPHQLEAYCAGYDIQLIHITTDCVFSGKDGNYDEGAPHDCLDIYGKSKSLGEPKIHAMTLRTSVIGEELHNNAGLVEWAKSQKGSIVYGYKNHLWNGVTTKTYAKICRTIIEKGLYEPGLFHVFSPEDITKLELLKKINERFQLGLKICAVDAPQSIDRTLRTIRDLNSKLNIPSLDTQMMEM